MSGDMSGGLNRTQVMPNVVIIGLGAISTGVLGLLAQEPGLQVTGVLVPEAGLAAARAALAKMPQRPGLAITAASRLQDLARPDLLVECAGHAALAEHVLGALAAGIPCIAASVGALSDARLLDQLEAAARQGRTRLQLVAGAIGAIDALAAARLGGLDSVRYTGTKPARAWAGTPAETLLDLATLASPTVFFEGTAREAATQYPKNANVAATVALAGLGLDNTRVRLVADPTSTQNTHQVEAAGAFGDFSLTMNGKPLAANPKTSALTVYSVARAVLNQVRPLVI